MFVKLNFYRDGFAKGITTEIIFKYFLIIPALTPASGYARAAY